MGPATERARNYSEAKIDDLRRRLDQVGIDDQSIVLTCGSFARREASASSDLDYFVISAEAEPAWLERARHVIADTVEQPPSEGGAFAKVKSPRSLEENIGGDDDSNQNITRRMLFLLESEWLHNREAYEDMRRKVLQRYIAEGIGDHQIAFFLLNDIIRYYRTLAVDYEFKTTEGADRKPWGLRNIKLVFSRKLLYASGLFSIALTAECSRDDKIAGLADLFGMPVIDRITKICGLERVRGVLEKYERFLSQLEDGSVRGHLNGLKRGEHEDRMFRELKNEGHEFTWELLKLFESTFDSAHPIRRAVVF